MRYYISHHKLSPCDIQISYYIFKKTELNNRYKEQENVQYQFISYGFWKNKYAVSYRSKILLYSKFTMKVICTKEFETRKLFSYVDYFISNMLYLNKNQTCLF